MRPYSMIVIIAACMVAPVLQANAARASDWMFRRSYYSHAAGPAPGVSEPESRVVYRQPWIGAHPRMAVRGGWRYNTMVLQNGTSGSDRTITREYWSDFNY
jgi:hypothetical protein